MCHKDNIEVLMSYCLKEFGQLWKSKSSWFLVISFEIPINNFSILAWNYITEHRVVNADFLWLTIILLFLLWEWPKIYCLSVFVHCSMELRVFTPNNLVPPLLWKKRRKIEVQIHSESATFDLIRFLLVKLLGSLILEPGIAQWANTRKNVHFGRIMQCLPQRLK